MNMDTLAEIPPTRLDPLPDAVRRLDTWFNVRIHLARSEADLDACLRAKTAAKRELAAVPSAQLDAAALALLSAIGGQ